MNGKVYKLVGNGKIYIGSTTQMLCKRKTGHVSDYKRGNHCTSYEIITDPNHYIELIENVPCNSKEELFIRERYWIENTECVNKSIPYKTKEETKEWNVEYYKVNKDKIIETAKQFYEDNKDKIIEQRKQYQEANKDKIREAKKLYREANKDKINERRRQLYHEKKLKLKYK